MQLCKASFKKGKGCQRHAQHAHVASLLHYASVLQSVNEANGMLERHLERLKKQLRQAEVSKGVGCALWGVCRAVYLVGA